MLKKVKLFLFRLRPWSRATTAQRRKTFWDGRVKSTTKRGVEVRRRSALLELELKAEMSFSLSPKRAEGQTQSSESLWADSSLNNKPFKLLCSACIWTPPHSDTCLLGNCATRAHTHKCKAAWSWGRWVRGSRFRSNEFKTLTHTDTRTRFCPLHKLQWSLGQ